MARRARIELLGPNAGAGVNAGATAIQTGTGNWFDWPGGDGVLHCEAAAFNAATIALQQLSSAGTALPIVNYATTTAIGIAANGTANFRAPAGQIRAVAGAATGVVASIIGVPGNVAG